MKREETEEEEVEGKKKDTKWGVDERQPERERWSLLLR